MLSTARPRTARLAVLAVGAPPSPPRWCCRVAAAAAAASVRQGRRLAATRRRAADPHTCHHHHHRGQGCVRRPDQLRRRRADVQDLQQGRHRRSPSSSCCSGERIVGEKENLPPGFSGAFTLSASGPATTSCTAPAPPPSAPLKVTGRAAGTGATDTVAALLKTAPDLRHLRQHPDRGCWSTGHRALATALKGTDLAAAQTAYTKARPYYERIEPVAESFVERQRQPGRRHRRAHGDTTCRQ